MPEARAARAQPRPRALLLLRLSHHDHAHQGGRPEAVAQEAVHRDGAQRVEPCGAFRTADGEHAHARVASTSVTRADIAVMNFRTSGFTTGGRFGCSATAAGTAGRRRSARIRADPPTPAGTTPTSA